MAVADRLDSSLVLDTLKAVGIDWRPPDVLQFARDLENKVASSVAVAYPEVREVIESLHKAGHAMYVATQAGEWNARGALEGAGLIDLVDGVFSGSSQRAFKNDLAYWREIPKAVHAPARELALVDDRLDYLQAASSAGFGAILLEGGGRTVREKRPRFVFASIPSLANLPPLLKPLSQRKTQRRS